MRMLRIAYSVFSVFDIDGPVLKHLDIPSVEFTLIIIGNHIGDAGLSGVEVVSEFLHLIGILALGHFGLSYPFSCKGVERSAGKDGT